MTLGRPDYETRKANRIDRLRARAEKTRREADARLKAADRIADMRFGQPIIIGHHSEKRSRRDQEKIFQGTMKGAALHREATRLEKQAESAESSRAISSDDPTAIGQLRTKLAGEQMLLEAYKSAAKQYRKATDDQGRRAALVAGGVSRPEFHLDRWPSFLTTNLSANIRRIKERISTLEKQAATPAPEPATVETTAGAIEIRTADNRTQILFPGKPSAAVRSELKASGFRWAPSAGAWQRLASTAAQYQAERIVAAVASGTLA